MAEPTTRTGGCICGGVRFKVTGPLTQPVACHCRECRRSTGHFTVSVNARTDDFELVENRELGWYRSGPKSRRGFCKTCGSSLFFQVDGADRISIGAGALDDGCDGGLRIAANIFTAEKGAYYDLDDAPSYPQGSDTVPMPPRD